MLPLISVLLCLAQPGAPAAGMPWKNEHFPSVTARFQGFEQYMNSPRVADRATVIYALSHRWHLPDPETTRFFKHVAKHDADATVRGAAVRALHDLWIPLTPADLPTSFTGYHNGQIIDRQDPKFAEKLLAEVKQGGHAGGYAAYVVSLLKLKEAVPDLRKMANEENIFVRYSAGRALLECGDRDGAATMLKSIWNNTVPPDAPIAKVADPYYQALAARAYIDIGPAERREGIERLIRLTKELEEWSDINADGRLNTARLMLATVSGKILLSYDDAKKWWAGVEK